MAMRERCGGPIGIRFSNAPNWCTACAMGVSEMEQVLDEAESLPYPISWEDTPAVELAATSSPKAGNAMFEAIVGPTAILHHVIDNLVIDPEKAAVLKDYILDLELDP